MTRTLMRTISAALAAVATLLAAFGLPVVTSSAHIAKGLPLSFT